GTPTWGKGLVQTVYNLSYGAGVALTTAKYYTPSGRLIQRDYSSYYDYYTHFGQPADVGAQSDEVPETPTGPEPAEVFSTDLGREVFGGGGITPDRLVELPDGPQILTSLFANNAFFQFAVDYHSQNPVSEESWQPEEDLLDRFVTWAEAEEISKAEDVREMLEDPAARDYVLRQIHADVFNSAFGTEASHKILARGDEQIQKALDLFTEAKALLDERHRLGKTASSMVAAAPADAAEGGGSAN
ncbi:MAG: S41 family peptidase, partial [Acidobacteriota bacterium]